MGHTRLMVMESEKDLSGSFELLIEGCAWVACRVAMLEIKLEIFQTIPLKKSSLIT
jgi:hypothetical protein